METTLYYKYAWIVYLVNLLWNSFNILFSTFPFMIVKLPQSSENKPRGLYFQRPFLGAYFWRGLYSEGNLRFKIDWASLILGTKFTFFFVLICI